MTDSEPPPVTEMPEEIREALTGALDAAANRHQMDPAEEGFRQYDALFQTQMRILKARILDAARDRM